MSANTSDTVREDDQRPLKKQKRDGAGMLPKEDSSSDDTSNTKEVLEATTEAEGDEEVSKVDESAETDEEDRGRKRSRNSSSARPQSREHSHSKSRSRSHKGEEHERRTVIRIVDGKEVRQHISRDRYHSRSMSSNEQTKSSTDRDGHTSTTKDGTQRKDEQSHSRERVRVSVSPDRNSGEEYKSTEYERDENGNVHVSGDDPEMSQEEIEKGRKVDESSYGYEKCDEREASRSRSRSRQGSRDRVRNRSRERNRGYERSVDINNGDGKGKDKERTRERDDSRSVTTVSSWSEDSNGDRSTSRKIITRENGSESVEEEKEEKSKSVVATNLPSSAGLSHVREIFSRVGDVKDVDSMELSYRFRHRANQYERSDRGAENNFLVTYFNSDDAEDAVYRMNGAQIDHHVIGVSLYDKSKKADFKQYPKGKSETTKQTSYDSGWITRGRRRSEDEYDNRSDNRSVRDRSYSRSFSRDRSYSQSSRGRSYSCGSRDEMYRRDSRDGSGDYSVAHSYEEGSYGEGSYGSGSYGDTASSNISPRANRPRKRRERSESPRRLQGRYRDTSRSRSRSR